MSKIIAIEGRIGDALAIWGAAALLHDGKLLNSVTGAVGTASDVFSFIAAGHLSRLPFELEIDDAATSKPLIAIWIQGIDQLGARLLADTGRTGGLVAHHRKDNHQIYVFESLLAYDMYAREITEDLLRRALFDADDRPAQRVLSDLAILLRPHDPAVNAIRAALADNVAVATRFALAALQTDEDRAAFRDLLEAATSTASRYVLHYADDPAASDATPRPTQGGGWDADVAAQALQGLSELHKEVVEPAIRKTWPFLNRRLPAPRFREMKAASAELHFTTALPEQKLGYRIARHLALRALEHALRGAGVEDVSTPDTQKTMDRIARPAQGIVLRQRPLGREAEEAVHVPEPTAAEIESITRLDMLAFQSGLIRDATTIEMHFSEERRQLLSVRDNGGGSVPAGVAYLQHKREFLWQLFIVSLDRHVTSDGSERLWLQSIEPLEPNRPPTLITAVPSAVVKDAYFLVEDCRIAAHPDGTLHTTFGHLPALPGSVRQGATLQRALEWMRTWDEHWLERELEATDEARDQWVRPGRPPKASTIDRVLWVLGNAGGELDVSELVARINFEFQTRVRLNNTRRERYSHPGLLEFRGTQRMALTERGRRRYKILAAVLGGIGFQNRLGPSRSAPGTSS